MMLFVHNENLFSETGGGKVSLNELRALAAMGEPVDVYDLRQRVAYTVVADPSLPFGLRPLAESFRDMP